MRSVSSRWNRPSSACTSDCSTSRASTAPRLRRAAVVGAHRPYLRQPERTGEDGEPVEQQRLLGGQQLVGGVDDRSERAVAGRGGASPAREQIELTGDLGREVPDAERGARAAPSSIARGSPSSGGTTRRRPRGRRPTGPPNPCARSRNSRIAGLSRSGPDGSGSGASRCTYSPTTSSRSRLVTRISRRGAASASASTIGASSASTDSALSRHSTAAARAGTHPTPPRILTPRHDDAGHLGQQVDQPIGTDRGEIRPERRRPRPANRCAASSASRVLPTPPGPTSVT